MQAIDFMNECVYSKQPGTVDNVKSHPKFVLICPLIGIFVFTICLKISAELNEQRSSKIVAST